MRSIIFFLIGFLLYPSTSAKAQTTLDLDLTIGYQAILEIQKAMGDQVVIEVAMLRQFTNMFNTEFELSYDPSILRYIKFEPQDIMEGALPVDSILDTTVVLGAVFLGFGQVAPARLGSLGHATFEVIQEIPTQTKIRLLRSKYSTTAGRFEFNHNISVQILPITAVSSLLGDLNFDSKIDFADFLLFVQNFGKTTSGDTLLGDLNTDAIVDFTDFLIFAQNFGKTAS